MGITGEITLLAVDIHEDPPEVMAMEVTVDITTEAEEMYQTGDTRMGDTPMEGTTEAGPTKNPIGDKIMLSLKTNRRFPCHHPVNRSIPLLMANRYTIKRDHCASDVERLVIWSPDVPTLL